jgi:hypothetical protein
MNKLDTTKPVVTLDGSCRRVRILCTDYKGGVFPGKFPIVAITENPDGTEDKPTVYSEWGTVALGDGYAPRPGPGDIVNAPSDSEPIFVNVYADARPSIHLSRFNADATRARDCVATEAWVYRAGKWVTKSREEAGLD